VDEKYSRVEINALGHNQVLPSGVTSSRWAAVLTGLGAPCATESHQGSCGKKDTEHLLYARASA
jgi:hypothetical protein